MNNDLKPEDLVAPCGLYCGDCYRYKEKLADMARDLRAELRAEKFSTVSEKLGKNNFFKTFRDYPLCYEVLGAMVKLRCKKACHGGGGPPFCKMRGCCEKKGIDGCWDCEEFETCKNLDFLKEFHDDAHVKNLRLIRKSGIDSFITGKRYW